MNRVEEVSDVTRSIEDIKTSYPDEWILLGNPEEDEYEQDILSGVVLYHSPDKREVCYLGKPRIAGYKKTALFFNRVTPREKRPAIVSIYSSSLHMAFYPIMTEC
jgi:hypothetical protein